jgi:hypothetical protein
MRQLADIIDALFIPNNRSVIQVEKPSFAALVVV